MARTIAAFRNLPHLREGQGRPQWTQWRAFGETSRLQSRQMDNGISPPIDSLSQQRRRKEPSITNSEYRIPKPEYEIRRHSSCTDSFQRRYLRISSGVVCGWM